MALTDKAVRNAKPTDKACKLSDRRGLFVQLERHEKIDEQPAFLVGQPVGFGSGAELAHRLVRHHLVFCQRPMTGAQHGTIWNPLQPISARKCHIEEGPRLLQAVSGDPVGQAIGQALRHLIRPDKGSCPCAETAAPARPTARTRPAGCSQDNARRPRGPTPAGNRISRSAAAARPAV